MIVTKKMEPVFFSKNQSSSGDMILPSQQSNRLESNNKIKTKRNNNQNVSSTNMKFNMDNNALISIDNTKKSYQQSTDNKYSNCHKNNECKVLSIDRKNTIDNIDSVNAYKSECLKSMNNEQLTIESFKNMCYKKFNCVLNFRNIKMEHFWQLCLIVFTSLICFTTASCVAGLTTPGRTFPPGDIVLEHGQDLRILCVYEKNLSDIAHLNFNSSDLGFFRNNQKMLDPYTKIINETTIELFVKSPPRGNEVYYCKLYRTRPHQDNNTDFVCMNSVAVGDKPQAPDNMSCYSNNWQNLNCSWVAKPNHISTVYNAYFKLPGRASARVIYPCPTSLLEDPPRGTNSCIWTTRSKPLYRTAYEFYNIYVVGSNPLGNVTIPYKFDHYANVIPAKVENLTVVSKTSDSAYLHWAVPFPLELFPPGFHHRIMYQNQWDKNKNWTIIDFTKKTHEINKYFNLTDLKYPNTVFDVRVFLKSAAAVGEDKWSDFASVTFRTLPTVPGQPPRTDVGGFEIVDNKHDRDIFVYWQTIPAILENGDKFTYQISNIEENGVKVPLTYELTRTYARFKTASYNRYNFDITASNIVGESPIKARITIPSKFETPNGPLAFTKIAFEKGVYELSWKPPNNNVEIETFTIFWCESDRDRPYPCTGYIDWVHVSNTTTIYNMTVPFPSKVYQFAISSNTKTSSSGMIWASCTVIHNQIVGKLKTLWIDKIGSNFMTVRWNLDCSDRIGIIKGYKIQYCPISSPFTSACKEPLEQLLINGDAHTTFGTVKGLKPYTTYQMTVSLVTKYGEGLNSEELRNTTLEAAPDTPENITITNITSSTISLKWNKPLETNGVLHSYVIYYNDNFVKTDDTLTNATIKTLLPFKKYKISVSACTVSCSNKSKEILGQTLIGIPGKINHQPIIRFINTSQILVNWSKPTYPGGNLDFYEVAKNNEVILFTNETEIKLAIESCDKERNSVTHQFKIRAINVDEYGNQLIGPWSDIGEGNCYGSVVLPKMNVFMWIGSFGLFIILCCIIIWITRIAWYKCKAMQDVEVKLPPGLQREKLLQKPIDKHIRHSSPNSSGSSGHESVTSSLTSDLHGSTDSGTEIDPVLSGNKLLDQTSAAAWESSLRQRNINNVKSQIDDTDTTKWNSYIKIQKNDDPIIDDTQSLARSTPNLTDSTDFMIPQQAWSSTGYISMPSSQDLSCSSNSSPIQKEPINPSTAYSIVGILPKATSTKIDLHQELTSSDEAKQKLPYVSFASLDKKPIDTVKSLNDLTFIKSGGINNIVDNVMPISNLEQSSITKPYVQAGMLDSIKKSTFSPDSCGFKTTITTPTIDTKPYVTIGDISDVNKSIKSLSLLDDKKQQSTTSGTSNFVGSKETNKPYVLASTIIPNIHDKSDDQSATISKDDDLQKKLSVNYPISWDNMDQSDDDDRIEDDRTKNVSKNISGYVAVSDLSKIDETDNKVTKISPYVQHHQLEK